MRKTIPISLALFAVVLSSCSRTTWTTEEKSLINAPDTLMRVLVTPNPADSAVLRTPSVALSENDIKAAEYATLADKMLATVLDQGGVGIAGPQVGILRRVVAVQRFDKPDKPFEVYPNIAIVAKRGDLVEGGEGCLSVPGRRGRVARFRDIDITYTSPVTLADTSETVQGFTAVIFQHECDHLDGVIYTDYL